MTVQFNVVSSFVKKAIHLLSNVFIWTEADFHFFVILFVKLISLLPKFYIFGKMIDTWRIKNHYIQTKQTTSQF